MDFKKDTILSVMKENFPHVGWEDSQYWELARTKFPEFNLPPADSIFVEEEQYTSNPMDIEVTTDSINNFTDSLDYIFENQEKALNDNPPQTYKEYESKYGLTNRIPNIDSPEWKQKTSQIQREQFLENQKKGLELSDVNPLSPITSITEKLFKESKANYISGVGALLTDPESWGGQYVPEARRESIKSALNQTVPALQYREMYGEDLYDVDYSKINNDVKDIILQGIVAMADPTTLISFMGGYGVGVKGAQMTVGKAGSRLLPQVMKWAQKNYPRYFIRGKNLSPSLTERVVKNSGEFINKMATGSIGMGSGSAVIGQFNSRADQRSKRGKYVNGDGSVNFVDTMMDTWEYFKDGAVAGAILHGVATPLAKAQMWTNAKWKMGSRNASVYAGKVLTNPISRNSIIGASFASSMLLDEEYSKQFNDADGNFSYARFAAASFTYGATMPLLFGIRDMVLRPRLKKGLTVRDKNVDRQSRQDRTKTEPVEAEFEVVENNRIAKYDVNNSNTAIVPQNKSVPRLLNRIQNDIIKDIKHESNKSIDIEHSSNEVSKELNRSIKNISEDMGVETPFEFFETDINRQTQALETIDGLKQISTIVRDSFKILNKAGIKNEEGDYVSVDLSKLTDDDIAFLTTVMPVALDSYNGYIMRYYNETIDLNNLTDGQTEYLNRFKEEYKVEELSDAQKTSILKALETKINSYDIIKKNINDTVIEGLAKNEQIPKKKKAVLDESREEVVNADGDIINIDKLEANKYKNEGKVLTVADAKKQGIDINEPEQLATAISRLSRRIEDLGKFVIEIKDEKSKKYKNTRLTDKEIEGLTENIKGDELEKIAKTKSSVAAIKDKLDIAALSEVMTPSYINKYMPFVSKLLKSSNKKSLINITKKDVVNFLDGLIEQRRAKGALAAISTGETTALRRTFKELKDADFIKTHPAPDSILGEYTKKLGEEKAAKTLERPSLPAMEVWFKESGKLTKKFKNASEADKLGLLLADRYPIRIEEINALRGAHIKFEDDVYFIELTRGTKTKDPQGIKGAAKNKGVKTGRIVYLPKSLALKIQKLGAKNPAELLFPKFSTKVTGALKTIPEFKGVKAKDYKRQIITFAGTDAVGLTPQERSAFNLMAGHAMDAASLTEADKSIIKLYENKQDRKTLLAIQKRALEKIANAREQIEQGQLGKFEEAFIEGIKAPGLTIKDVSGKPPKESAKQISKEVDKGKDINKELKKKLIGDTKLIFREITKDMNASDAMEMADFYAKQAGIEDADNFIGKLNMNTPSEEIALFVNEISRAETTKLKQRKQSALRFKNIMIAKDKLVDAGYDENAQKQFIKKIFDEYRDLPDDQVSLLNLSEIQTISLLDIINTSPEFKTRNRFSNIQDAINIENVQKIVRDVPTRQQIALETYLLGDATQGFAWLDKQLKTGGVLTQLGLDLAKHSAIEQDVGGLLKGFEVEAYKILHYDAVEKGKFVTPAIRKQKKVYINGKKIFDKEIKNKLWTLEPKRYPNLKKHVEKHPEDKVAVKRLENVESFYNNIYTDKGTLRIDTVESQIARVYYKYTRKIMDMIKIALRKSMNDAQYQKFIKQNPIQEIIKHFYVPYTITKDFKNFYDPNTLNLIRQEQKGALYHAQKLAEQKYGTAKVTPEQINEFYEKGRALARADLLTMSDFGANMFNPKHMLKRKMYLGERVFISKENKWIDVYNTEYDAYMPSYAGASAKLIANLEALPFMVDMPGLKINKNIPKILVDLSREKGVIPRYIHNMISSRSGLMTPQDYGPLGYIARFIGSGNKYISRVNLSGIGSPVKNFRIAMSQNALRFDLNDICYNAARAMSFAKRMEASRTGYMGLSLSGLTEADNTFVNKLFDDLFNTMRFPTSEQIGRLSSMFLSLQRLPKFVDDLRLPNMPDGSVPKKRKTAENEATSFYKLSNADIIITDTPGRKIIIKGGQIELLKRFGLASAEVDYTGRESVGVKGIDVKRFNKAGEVIKFDGETFKLTPNERAKLQSELDIVHLQILQMAHMQTQASTVDIFQPAFLLSDKSGLVKAGMLYTQIAMNSTNIIVQAFKDSHKSGNYHRILAYLATAYGLNEAAEYFLYDLMKIKTRPGELDRHLRDKLFRGLQNAEVGGIGSFMFGIANGEAPLGNPLFPFAFASQSVDIFNTLLDIAAYGLEKGDVEFQKVNWWRKHLIRDKRYFQSVEDATESIGAAYRDFKSTYLNNNHPYRLQQKKLDDLERKFYKDTPFMQPEIIKYSVMTGHYREIKEAFEKSGGVFQGFYKMQPEDWDHFNDVIINAWWARKNLYIEGGMLPDESSKAASKAIEDKLMSLHPILNGQGNKKDSKKYMTIRNEYKAYVQKLALDQGKDKNFYWSAALEQEKKYYLKMDRFLKQWSKWISNHDNYKLEENLKYFKKLYPTRWDQTLGIIPSDKTLKKYKGKFVPIKLDSAKVMDAGRIENLARELNMRGIK